MSKAPVQKDEKPGIDPAELGRELPNVRPVGMSGDFPSRVSVAPGSTTSLILASAIEQETERPVLVPFVDLKVSGVLQSEMQEGADEQNFGTLLASTLPLENAVFLYFDMVRDLSISLNQLADATGRHHGLEVERLKLAHLFSDQLAREASGLRDIIGTLAKSASQHGDDDKEAEPSAPDSKVANSSTAAARRVPRLRKSSTAK